MWTPRDHAAGAAAVFVNEETVVAVTKGVRARGATRTAAAAKEEGGARPSLPTRGTAHARGKPEAIAMVVAHAARATGKARPNAAAQLKDRCRQEDAEETTLVTGAKVRPQSGGASAGEPT